MTCITLPAATDWYLLMTLQVWGLCIGLIQAAPTTTVAFTDTLYLWMVSAGSMPPGSRRDADISADTLGWDNLSQLQSTLKGLPCKQGCTAHQDLRHSATYRLQRARSGAAAAEHGWSSSS
jgi:hypothetical protein